MNSTHVQSRADIGVTMMAALHGALRRDSDRLVVFCVRPGPRPVPDGWAYLSKILAGTHALAERTKMQKEIRCSLRIEPVGLLPWPLDEALSDRAHVALDRLAAPIEDLYSCVLLLPHELTKQWELAQ